MMKSACNALLLLAMLTLAGCATSLEVRHYLLTPVEAAGAAGSEPGLAVGPVMLPDYLLRREFVRRVDQQELRYVAESRWAESLDAGIQRVIMANLGALLDTRRVQPFPGLMPAADDYRVALQVDRFELVDGAAVARVEWSLYLGTAGVPLAAGTFDERVQVQPGTGAAVAAGFSELLAGLAREISAAVAREHDGTAP
jgi:uncharacterized lipoprotein YmbA